MQQHSARRSGKSSSGRQSGDSDERKPGRKTAADMVENFAMTTYGATPAEILLEEKEITGARFKALFYPE